MREIRLSGLEGGEPQSNAASLHLLKRMSKMFERYEQLLLIWYESKGLSSGIVAGFNNNTKLTMRKSYGFMEVKPFLPQYIIRLATCPTQFGPANSTEVARIVAEQFRISYSILKYKA
jgi:hypothetical protein